MSLRRLNKKPFTEPEKEDLEEHMGPSKTLKETIEICNNLKSGLREVQHCPEKRNTDPEASSGGGKMKQQLWAQLMKTKREVVRLGLWLSRELHSEETGDWGDEDGWHDVFSADEDEGEGDWEGKQGDGKQG